MCFIIFNAPISFMLTLLSSLSSHVTKMIQCSIVAYSWLGHVTFLIHVPFLYLLILCFCLFFKKTISFLRSRKTPLCILYRDTWSDKRTACDMNAEQVDESWLVMRRNRTAVASCRNASSTHTSKWCGITPLKTCVRTHNT